MNKTKTTLAILLVLLLGGFLTYSFVQSSPERNTKVVDNSIDKDTSKEDLATLLFPLQINEEGPVSVSTQPLIASLDASGFWEFEIILNTHSVELTTDISEAIVLIDDSGNEYKPLKWEGDPPEGHHREINVFFESLGSSSKTITILARDIGGVSERKFLWITTP